MRLSRRRRRRRAYRGRDAPAAYDGRVLYAIAAEPLPEPPVRPPEEDVPRLARWWHVLFAFRRLPGAAPLQSLIDHS